MSEFTARCPDCTYVGSSMSQPMADYALRKHSCERQRLRDARAGRAKERLTSSGVKRDCEHKRAHHEHGTSAGYLMDKCRCRPCRNAQNARERERTRLKAYGRYDPGRVDAQPAREHIAALTEYGIGLKRISALAGISHDTLGKIVYGAPARNIRPRERVARHVHDAILSVKPTLENLGQTVPVDGTGTRRRLQALVYIGYSVTGLARRMDIDPANLLKTIHRDKVNAETARAVAKLYTELQDRPTDGFDHHSQCAASRARNQARREGWFPPAAWDEDTIDDPAAVPDMGGQQRRAEAVLEDVEWLARTGANRAEVVDRLSVTWDYVVAVAGKAGRQDLLDTIQGFTRDNARKASKPGRAA